MLTTCPCRRPACSSVLCALQSGRLTPRLGQTGFNPEGKVVGLVVASTARMQNVLMWCWNLFLEPLKELLSPRPGPPAAPSPRDGGRRAIFLGYWPASKKGGGSWLPAVAPVKVFAEHHVILWIEAYRWVFVHSSSPGAQIVRLCPTGAAPSPAPGALPSRGQPCCSCGRPHVQPPPPHLLGVCRSLAFIVNSVDLWFYRLVALFLNVEI